MNKNSEVYDLELICVIVNFGLGSRLVKSAKRHGISGGIIILGKGTAKSHHILDFMGLSDIRKEIVFLIADKVTVQKALEDINREFELYKPNRGIAFTTSICNIFGKKNVTCENKKSDRGEDNTMYHLITIIVDKGKAEEVIDAATNAGSKGGTILNARWSGISETTKLFSMEIEPEKEVVIILSESEMTESIVSSIRGKLRIDEPGNGIIYIQEVIKAYGIFGHPLSEKIK